MSHISKRDLAVFFGSSELQGSKASSVEVNVNVNNGSKDLLRDSYVKCNRSLIMKIHQLEVKIRNNNRTIDELREENASLKKKLYDRENLENSDILDSLVEERIKRKLHKVENISTRTIDYLLKAASNLREAFEDFGLELEQERQTRTYGDVKQNSMKAGQISEGERPLNDVCESPPLVSKSKKVSSCFNIEESKEVCNGNETLLRTQHAESGSTRDKSFRSGFDRKENGEVVLQSGGASCSDEVVHLAGTEAVHLAGTPSVSSGRPVVEPAGISWSELDTVRRKRAAALKIKNMAEPRLNNKLRRPSRLSEPHPFISSTY